MGRLLPCPLGRPENILSQPAVGDRLPGSRPGWLGEAPRWIPGVLQGLAAREVPARPWEKGCDLLLAPWPEPGSDTESTLLETLGALPPAFPVALFEAETPILPNLLWPAETRDRSLAFAGPEDGLRAWRSAFRQQGRGFAEALALLPARRAAWLLRGSRFAEHRPRSGGSLLNRRFLVAALDHARSLAALHGAGGAPREAPRRVLALMPHFDDEVIQAGIALQRARSAGAEVQVVWLTDGARGIPGLEPAEASRRRKEEARRALEVLGIEDLEFLDAPETRLRVRGPWTGRLRRLLLDFRPERIHLVWWGDNNVDHFEANRVLRAAWPRELEDCELAVSGLWTALPGGRALVLSPEEREQKDQALRCYASQLEAVDYLRAERGLAAWYARDTGQAFAERFLFLGAPDYWRRYRATGVARRWFLGA